MSSYFNQRPNTSEQQEKYDILHRANGRCECDSTRHDHNQKCNRRLYSTYRFYSQIGDQANIRSYNSVVVCSVCARYIKDVGY